ncbi:MAG: thiamine pyrophosphate-dependent dehydrogenase E1 component subunit alpha [Geminicoccaceae bacterium]|nr:thiamine pyrophosphate-dependent dehydrogenase E1 component subunit alpha [Geminicoccaceae bacterium]MCS7269115.1 thiamine pyrophosphate-dependent dehydrogenase E1 component subunit alpha [Geminicoccaceae bacterium]MCX7629294.1 thiamine pyrophosphate-dependent dehydrogenase E1 component subunit alpha [Geminicoccaceae bacterium]MDW8125794.1 thiamine pyrophosphate-dependent dehydrogenase E1 component subunit alpha [Geminicoccaceae bacterium]MDW8342661.1 thiamine pyrophosphate-dependent dehydro
MIEAEAPRDLDRARLVTLFRVMVAIRRFEELALEAAREGLVTGAIHPSIGQEAVAAGVCLELRREDYLLSTHRGHGHSLAKGADPFAMAAELMGRKGGTANGKGGSMHIADFSVGMLGANGVVAANIGIAAGAAHAVRLSGEDRVVCCIFGDGAVNRGPFLEGLNWAAIHRLPVLFVCEDNGFAATTRTRALTAGPGPLARARALGIDGLEVDGNDALAVSEATRALLAEIRGGNGPRFLHAKTYRLCGHTQADAGTYRSAEEVEEQRKRCPIARARALLRGAGLDERALSALEEEARAPIEAAFAAARAAPWPEPELAFTDVQDFGAEAPTRTPESAPWRR